MAEYRQDWILSFTSPSVVSYGMSIVEFQGTQTNDTSYLTIMGDLWGVYCRYLANGENTPCLAPYHNVFIPRYNFVLLKHSPVQHYCMQRSGAKGREIIDRTLNSQKSSQAMEHPLWVFQEKNTWDIEEPLYLAT